MILCACGVAKPQTGRVRLYIFAQGDLPVVVKAVVADNPPYRSLAFPGC